MIAVQDLKKRAKENLKDAEVLLKSRRHHSSLYLCGYTLEFALKARICKTLGWKEFPDSPGEFKDLMSFKTHDLNVLLRLSGVENKIKTSATTDWSIAGKWKSEIRYKQTSSNPEKDAKDMIVAVKSLLKKLQ